MTTTCIACGAKVQGAGYCREHDPRRLRGHRRWHELAATARASGRCALCGIVTDVLEADHIVPVHVAPGLAYDPGNVRALCIACHRKRR